MPRGWEIEEQSDGTFNVRKDGRTVGYSEADEYDAMRQVKRRMDRDEDEGDDRTVKIIERDGYSHKKRL